MSPEEETVINRNIMKLQGHLYKALKQRNQYKAENDTLIDNLAVLKANISRLERENEELFLSEVDLQEKVNRCLEEVVKVTDKYNTLTNHIRLKAENNPGVSRYIDLVNYVDRLERDKMAYEYKFIELRKILEKSHLGLYRPGYYFGLNGLEIEVRKDDVKLYGVTDLKEKIGIQIKVDNDIYYKTEELKEVYRKARAWEELKELLMEEYPQLIRTWELTHGEGEHAEYCKANEILENMDKLDGTNEFNNLLSDLEDE